MNAPGVGQLPLDREACVRAIEARDPRFDGVFFVGITSTRIYCRPICPARVSRPDNRRFFGSAAAAEQAGFRPCLRCRPELAPGRGVVHAVSRLADAAAQRIAEGALNRGGVPDLARELHVSPRHLRRALVREVGVPPGELAQTHRLLLAKRLLTDTSLPMSRVAEASGFQSLRRFNAAFRERYRMSPSSLRRRGRSGRTSGPWQVASGDPREDQVSDADRRPQEGAAAATVPGGDLIRLSLAYREPMSWTGTLAWLQARAVPGVHRVYRRRFARTVEVDGLAGVVFAQPTGVAAADPPGRPVGGEGTGFQDEACLEVHVSLSLLPVLMPLIARVRRLFDLDAEPAVVDACLAEAGLASQVAKRPGLRLPGAMDGFESACLTLLFGGDRPGPTERERAGRLFRAQGRPLDSGVPGLDRLSPTPAGLAEAGRPGLVKLGIPPERAGPVTTFARLVAEDRLRLHPGMELEALREQLLEIEGVGEPLATLTVLRSLYWPDAFPANDPTLLRARNRTDPRALQAEARGWRPWRSYAAQHLWLDQLDLT